jgi:outer membrane protein assembly factor BamB
MTVAVAILAGYVAVGSPPQSQWTSSGQNNHNTRYGAAERILSADNVGRLKPRWTFTTAGDISAVATVVYGVAYVPDWGGKLWAVDIETGKALWSHDIDNYTGTTGSVSRTSPAYWNGDLIIGTGNVMSDELTGAFEIGLNARTGAMLWRTRTDASEAAIMTGSPTVDNGLWTALDAATGRILWQTTDPQGAEYITDGFVSSANGVVYAGSSGGNFYAMDARTGQIKWTFPSGGAVWSGAAINSTQNCSDAEKIASGRRVRVPSVKIDVTYAGRRSIGPTRASRHLRYPD